MPEMPSRMSPATIPPTVDTPNATSSAGSVTSMATELLPITLLLSPKVITVSMVIVAPWMLDALLSTRTGTWSKTKSLASSSSKAFTRSPNTTIKVLPSVAKSIDGALVFVTLLPYSIEASRLCTAPTAGSRRDIVKSVVPGTSATRTSTNTVSPMVAATVLPPDGAKEVSRTGTSTHVVRTCGAEAYDRKLAGLEPHTSEKFASTRLPATMAFVAATSTRMTIDCWPGASEAASRKTLHCVCWSTVSGTDAPLPSSADALTNRSPAANSTDTFKSKAVLLDAAVWFTAA